MRKKKISPIIIALVIFIVAAAATGFYYFNKGPVNISSAVAQKISAEQLYRSFQQDTIQASKNYSGKVLEVTGLVTRTSKNQQGQTLIFLKTTDNGGVINCTMQKDAEVLQGNTVTLKGLCNGIGEAVPELGIAADIYLSQCLLK
ncbi:MAG: hypothetical protein JWQ27_951 [Ferruginibacter sp.]|nr:hypothetical protein [Ferruginibacter sp.]